VLGGERRRRRLHRVGIGGERDRADHLVAPVALGRRLHAFAVEGDVLVADVARPRIDHLHRVVDGDVVVGAERDGFAAVVVDVGAAAEQRGEREARRRQAAALSS
jgi:hypothetical protein